MKFNKLLDINSKEEKIKLRGNFLARVFGIFNEEIIRIWCRSESSPYIDKGRPTIKIKDSVKRGSTLDFTLENTKTNEIYVAEMKCWIAYNNYKYLELNSGIDLNKFTKDSTAFTRFLDLPQNPQNYNVTIKNNNNRMPINVNGSILVWSKVKKEDKKDICKKYNFFDIIDLEQVINDLIREENKEYFDLLEQKKDWFNHLISGLNK